MISSFECLKQSRLALSQSIPPFKVKLEQEHEVGWNALIVEQGTPNFSNLGPFGTRSEAEQAALAKVKESYGGSGKDFPGTITWTTTTALLLPERPETGVPSDVWKQISQVLPIGLGIAAMIAGFVVNLAVNKLRPTIPSQDAELRKLAAVLANTTQDIAAVRQALKAFQPSSTASGEIAALKGEVERLRERFASFELALGDNLDKRLAVPLMRKDLDAIKEQYKGDLAAVDARLSLVVDLMKWLLGIIGFGGFLSGLSKRFAKPSPKRDSETSTTSAALNP